MTTRRRHRTQQRTQHMREQAGRLITRIDPDIPPRPHATTLEFQDRAQYLQAQELLAASPDAATFRTVLAVEEAFLQYTGAPSIGHADPRAADAFIAAGTTPSAQLLRGTSLSACSIARSLIGQDDPTRPRTMGAPPSLIHWSSRRSHSRHRCGAPARAQQRAATSDEVLLTRLAVRITEHRHPAAVGVCVALASSGATQSEVPAVLTGHLAEHRRAVRLPGRHVHNPDSAHYLPPRWVDLDAWSAHRIDAALQR